MACTVNTAEGMGVDTACKAGMVNRGCNREVVAVESNTLRKADMVEDTAEDKVEDIWVEVEDKNDHRRIHRADVCCPKNGAGLRMQGSRVEQDREADMAVQRTCCRR